MSATDRENRLLVAENWTKIYQSFKNADFQSYDFENLRRTMVNYLRQNYPEDFNDYIESSEYLALIDLIAFLGQNIAFRVDLNARENFLELAERRESILRLARVISYNAKRNVAATGLLKVSAIQTTENVVDSNGRSLANQSIIWNDVSNQNWYDQFIRVINAAMSKTQQFGNPIDSASIYGIPTHQYRLQATNTDVPVYTFTKTVSGLSMNFEITSTTFNGQSYIYEEPPKVGNSVACVYRDDGHGAGSANSGFFFNFKQGTLNTGLFTITHPSSNESIDIDTPNINNDDVWLYQLDMSGLETSAWTRIESLTGNNVIYNSLNKNIKNLYSVSTKTNDAISLIFGDGTYGSLPQGTFRAYYRISNGLSYIINTTDIRNVTVDIPYLSSDGRNQTLTVTLGLTTAVSNSAPTESNTSIKTNAPQNFYTQNRMISGEDYNIVPLVSNQQVLKIKAVNRSSSGISRYFDLKDPTSKYSSTTLFSDDGVLYSENKIGTSSFTFVYKTDIAGIINNTVLDIISGTYLRNFYYSNFVLNSIFSNSVSTWTPSVTSAIDSTGTVSTTSLFLRQYLKVGALVKFVAPVGYYFDTNDANTLKVGNATVTGSTHYIWAEIVNIPQNNTYVLNKPIPAKSVIISIIPKYVSTLTEAVSLTMVDLIYSNQLFALRYDETVSEWKIILANDLNLISKFDKSFQGDESNMNLDASWLLMFSPRHGGYTISSREVRYVFESDSQLRFYFDGTSGIYNTPTSSMIYDEVRVLSNNINNQLFSTDAVGAYNGTTLRLASIVGVYTGMVISGINVPPNAVIINVNQSTRTITIDKTLQNAVSSVVYMANVGNTSYTADLLWKISAAYVGTDGYVDTKKVIVSFVNSSTGIADDPELFTKITTSSNYLSDYIIERKYNISLSQEDYRYDGSVNVKIMDAEVNVGNKSSYTDGQYFYFIDTDVVKKLNKSTSKLEVSLDFKVLPGRGNLKFQYTHAADYASRIDPGASNIMDIYVLMQSYDTAYRRWLNNASTKEPLAPSSFELYDTLAPKLNLLKATSDEIIFHPVSYTVLFGSKAIPELQAIFKIIKNPEQVVSDNDVQARAIAAINQFFAIENWNFGDTFYFAELSAYVIKTLSPYIVSFVIVPKQEGKYFGSLFEIKADNNQLYISGATVDDIQIINGITTTEIKSASGIQTATSSQQTVSSSPYGS